MTIQTVKLGEQVRRTVQVSHVHLTHLCLIVDVDLPEKGTGKSENVVERLVSERAGHLAMFGQGAHGFRQVHFHHQVVQDLHTYHTVLNRPLHSREG